MRMESWSESSHPAAEVTSSETKLKIQEIKEEEEQEEDHQAIEGDDAAEAISTSFESSLQEAYELQRLTKHDLRREERRLIWLQDELNETVKTIRDDRQRIMALHNEQSFTAKQIKDALAIDLKHYEATLRSKQPDLFGYCRQAANARDCLVIIHSIRQCRRHIQLAEMLLAHRYAIFLSEKQQQQQQQQLSPSPYTTSHSTAAVLSPAAVVPGAPVSSDGQQSPPVSGVQSSPLCPAFSLSGYSAVQSFPGGPAASTTSSQLPVLRHTQTRSKTEKTKSRRLSLVKVDHKPTITPVTNSPTTSTMTTAPITTVARMTAVSPTTTVATATSSASTSFGSVTSSAKTASSRDGACAASGGSASTDVVRVEMRDCDSRSMWSTSRDVRPIVLTYISK